MSEIATGGLKAAADLYLRLIRDGGDQAQGTALHPERPTTPTRWVPTFSLIPYQAVDPAQLGLLGTESFHDLSDEPLDQAITQVIKVEGPVHFLVLADRLLTAADVGRLGARIRERIEQRLKRLAEQGSLVQQGEFIGLDQQFLMPRWRDWRSAPDKTRQLDHVHDGELMLCLFHAVLRQEGAAVDEAMNTGLHRIGFIRLTENAKERLQSPLEALLRERILIDRRGQLYLGPEALTRGR